jgi:hypothetical protein
MTVGALYGVRDQRGRRATARWRIRPNVSAMHVELLWWDGCPSHPKALADLRTAMDELDLDPDDIESRQVETEQDAERERFVGSPTIRIDGAEVSPVEGEPSGLTCRVYHRRDGRVSPTPDPADLRDALRAAMTTTERN